MRIGKLIAAWHKTILYMCEECIERKQIERTIEPNGISFGTTI
jgi:hypothetical protein